MKKYLVTYREDFGAECDTIGSMMTPFEIARLYGTSDYTGVSNIRAFRISIDGAPVEVKLDVVPSMWALRIIDRETGEILGNWNWPER